MNNVGPYSLTPFSKIPQYKSNTPWIPTPSPNGIEWLTSLVLSLSGVIAPNPITGNHLSLSYCSITFPTDQIAYSYWLSNHLSFVK